MRLLVLHTRHREPGGEDQTVETESALLRARGHDVVIHEWTNPHGAAAIPALLRTTWDRRAATTVRALVRDVSPDVVHVHNMWFALSPSVLPAVASTGTPLVVTLHNYRMMCLDHTLFRDGRVCLDCVGKSPVPGVLHRCYRGSAALSSIGATTIATARRRGAWDAVDRFVAPSELVRRLHVAGGVDEHRIVVKPHCCADPGAREHPPSASHEVLFVGRLAPGKGLEHAVEGWGARAGAGHDGLRLHVLGDGPSRAAVERDAPADVVFEGWVEPSALQARMRSARALLFGSEWLEPFGLVLIEALAAGLPIVGSDVGDTPAIVGEAGVLAPPRVLAQSLLVLSDDGAIDALGRAARARWEAHYSPSVAAPALEAIYAGLPGAST
jgi:glycosyltransferase involved in cell wall biosynthesis